MKKIILLFAILISALTFTSCTTSNSDNAVAYSIAPIADTWKGNEAHYKLIVEYLIKNDYYIENLIYNNPVDAEMIKIFDAMYGNLKKANENGELAKVLKDQDFTGGQITFDYGLQGSKAGIMKKELVTVTY